MNFAVYETPLGLIELWYNSTAICGINRLNQDEFVGFGVKTPLAEIAATQLAEYFDGSRRSFDFPMETQGTPFQKSVWSALCAIPYGETRSYKDIAIAIGNPKACRAVGMANNRNPISIAVPCHRVLGANGALVGYGGGLDMKEFLLRLERANMEVDK